MYQKLEQESSNTNTNTSRQLTPVQRKTYWPSSAVQRQTEGSLDSSVNGIRNRDNIAFNQMYGYSLHDAGVSVRHISVSDSALKSVGASSLIQGNQIVCGNAADLHHEYAHVPQQLSGLVQATETVNGQAVNSDAHWESMADRDGDQMRRIAKAL